MNHFHCNENHFWVFNKIINIIIISFIIIIELMLFVAIVVKI